MSVSITIEFPDERHMRYFLGQVSDGAMENMVDIEPLNPEPTENGRWHVQFGGADKFRVSVFELMDNEDDE